MGDKRRVLMMTAIPSAETLCAAMAQQLDCDLELAETRKACIAALRREQFDLLIVDEALIEGDPETADLIWKLAGLAVPLQLNFAISGTARLVREARSALSRKDLERGLAARAATTQYEGELRSKVAGMLLHTELALAEPQGSPKLAGRLRTIHELAGSIRQQLDGPAA
jgi:hypothetical protein